MGCYFLVWGTQGSIRRHVKIVSVYAVITTESSDKGVGKLIIANSDGMSPWHVLNSSLGRTIVILLKMNFFINIKLFVLTNSSKQVT